MLLAALDGGTPKPKSPLKPTETIDNAEEISTPPVTGPSSSKTNKGEVDTGTPKTPLPKTGHVKATSYGTPVMNIASPYEKLPSDVKFSKDICDVINFENLPDSTGKYKKICSLLKKVKDEVDRIQDS